MRTRYVEETEAVVGWSGGVDEVIVHVLRDIPGCPRRDANCHALKPAGEDE